MFDHCVYPYHTYHHHHHHHGASPLSEINTGDPVFCKKIVHGKEVVTYHINYIKLIDAYFNSFIRDDDNCASTMTIEQRRWLDRYLYEAGIVLDKMINNKADPYKNMDPSLRTLDYILGGL